MISTFRNLAHSTDSAVSRLYLSVFQEQNALRSFLFHSLFRNHQEMDRNLIDPLDRTTVDDLRQLIAYYRKHGYVFISPDDIVGGLSDDQKYAMLTFDDGYYNNHLALPLLEEFNVPATFFIASGHVRNNKCFWWDVLYRERMAQGVSQRQIYREGVKLKFFRADEIDDRLRQRFGPNAFAPRGDIDRPFTPEELRKFAAHPLVHLGNHTVDHAILANCPATEIRRQIRECQDDLEKIGAPRPFCIAYPNGSYNDEVLRACVELGIRLGFTTRPQRVRLPLNGDPSKLLTLGRFVPGADAPIVTQCRTYRSDLQIYGFLRSAYLKMFRGSISN
jgi:peptidoglycan/xylan/chitin deacetylase (PgdA/CDA1 family)